MIENLLSHLVLRILSFSIGMFSLESCSPEYSLFSPLFFGIYPPPPDQNLTIFILLYRSFLFFIFIVRLAVQFCLFYGWFCFFAGFFLFYHTNVFSYFQFCMYCFIFTFFFPTCTCIAPTSAVEYQRIPRSSRRCSVSGAGCPYRLFLPQEIRTTPGCAKSSSASPVALEAPWCPASRMVQRRGFCVAGRAYSTSQSSPLFSRSPVSSI